MKEQILKHIKYLLSKSFKTWPEGERTGYFHAMETIYNFVENLDTTKTNLRVVGIKYPPEYFQLNPWTFICNDPLPDECKWEFATGPEDANRYLLVKVVPNKLGETSLSDPINFYNISENPQIWRELATNILQALALPVLYAADIEYKMSGIFYEGFAHHKYDE